MAVAFDASSPAAVYADAFANTAVTTASFTPPSGSIIVVKVVSDDGAQTHSTPTGSGLTFTSRANLGTASASCRISLWTAVGAGAATTISANFAGTTQDRGLSVSVWTGAQLAASPAVATIDGSTANGAPSLTLTTTAANSVVDWVIGDWAAIDGTTRTYRSSATERAYHRLVNQYTTYSASQVAAAAGSQTFGLTAPIGQKPTMAGIEIQSSGAAVATPIRRIGKRTW